MKDKFIRDNFTVMLKRIAIDYLTQYYNVTNTARLMSVKHTVVLHHLKRYAPIPLYHVMKEDTMKIVEKIGIENGAEHLKLILGK